MKKKTCDVLAIIVTIETENQKLKLSAIYSQPRYNIYEDEYTILFIKQGGYLIIGEDFNAKQPIGVLQSFSQEGRKLYKGAASFGC